MKWQDGQAFSSDDVKFTFEYLGHPDNPHPLTDDFANIVGAKEFKAKQASDISGLKVAADHVEISLIAPSNSFLVNVATAIMMPRHVLQDVAPADFPKHPFARQPIYTGPFKVDEWKSGESITYSAFADHFKGRPKLDKVVQRIFPDPTTAVTELRSGGIQQAFIANPDQFGEFQTNSSYSTQQLAGTLGWFFSWDMTNQTFPFAEKDFRSRGQSRDRSQNAGRRAVQGFGRAGQQPGVSAVVDLQPQHSHLRLRPRRSLASCSTGWVGWSAPTAFV